MGERRKGFFQTIRHQQSDQVPYFFVLCQELKNRFIQKYGGEDYKEFFDLPFREVFLNPTRTDIKGKYLRYTDKLTGEYQLNEWGIGIKRGSVGHFFTMRGPLVEMFNAEAIKELPLPDFLADYRWKGVSSKIESYKQRDFITMTGIFGDTEIGAAGTPTNVPAFISTFENSWYLRGGLDRFLLDLYLNPELAALLLDRVTEFNAKLAAKWASVGIDIIVFGDDMGGQNSLLIDPESYRKWFKPRLKKVIQAAKGVNPEVLIYYHSDGNIEPIIPDLIEVGVEILNPIQPECMDPAALKKQYGRQLTFWGTLGTQTTMPFGTQEEVRRVCKKMITEVGSDGGLVLAPTHLLEPEVPLENIEAFVSTVKNTVR